jgi:hypothetical protein
VGAPATARTDGRCRVLPYQTGASTVDGTIPAGGRGPCTDPKNQQLVGPALARRGYVVAAIDACFNGERVGKGPAGARLDKGSYPQELSLFKLYLWQGRSLWGLMPCLVPPFAFLGVTRSWASAGWLAPRKRPTSTNPDPPARNMFHTPVLRSPTILPFLVPGNHPAR